MKELIIKDTIGEYLSASKYINWKDNSILSKADEFKPSAADEISLIKTVYEFVRDEIKHSWDVQDKCVTKSATEVLEQEVGICWAKNPSDKLMQVLEENTDALYMYLNCLPDNIFEYKKASIEDTRSGEE